jgi:hypothetical protein
MAREQQHYQQYAFDTLTIISSFSHAQQHRLGVESAASQLADVYSSTRLLAPALPLETKAIR